MSAANNGKSNSDQISCSAKIFNEGTRVPAKVNTTESGIMPRNVVQQNAGNGSLSAPAP